MILRRLAVCLVPLLFSAPALAAKCGGDFQTFIAAISQEARAQGVSQAVITQALGNVSQDQAVLAFDRRQRGTFNKTFEQYVATRVGLARIKRASAMLQRHASLLARIEQRFGVRKVRCCDHNRIHTKGIKLFVRLDDRDVRLHATRQPSSSRR